MKLRRLVPIIASLTLSLGLAACEKSDDIPHIQEEANGVVAAYAARFDEMQQRSVWLQERSSDAVEQAGPKADASGRLRGANQRLGALRAEVQQAPAEIANAAKTSRQAVQGKLDSLNHSLNEGELLVNAELDEIEAFLERAEEADSTVAMGPAAMEPSANPSTTEPQAPPTGPTQPPAANPTAPSTNPTNPSGTSNAPSGTPQVDPPPAARQAPPPAPVPVPGGH